MISDIDYLKITPKNLGLPKAYELIDGTGSKAKGSIFSDGIYMEGNGKEISAAGRKLRVTVKSDFGYQLSKLYVNGKAISKSVKVGRKVAIKARVTASKGANKTLIYSVSNKKYASVNSTVCALQLLIISEKWWADFPVE